MTRERIEVVEGRDLQPGDHISFMMTEEDTYDIVAIHEEEGGILVLHTLHRGKPTEVKVAADSQVPVLRRRQSR